MLFLDHLRSTPLYRALCAVHDSPEGNTLELIDPLTAEAQIEFHRWALSMAAADRILEIGHNKGMYGLLLAHCRPGVALTAIDGNPHAAKAAELLNEDGRITVTFQCGDSQKVLPKLRFKFGLAWVDGGHQREVALSDLRQCSRLAIPWVAVDDTAYPTVADAVADWLAKAPYEEVLNPYLAHDSRKARLYRRVGNPAAVPGVKPTTQA